MSAAVQLRLEGEGALKALLSELPKRVSTKADRAAVTKAGRVVAKAAKSRAPKESGLLKKAITSVVTSKSKSRGGVATARIGAKRGVSGEYKGRKRVPSRYIHLVEKKNHGGSHFMAEAWSASKNIAAGIVQETYRTTIENEARKLGKL